MKSRFLKYSLLIVGGILFIISLFLAFLLSNKSKIQQYAIKQLNEQLLAKVAVDEIDLTLFQQFPFVSLDFKKVKISEPENDEKTLLTAEHVFISFNIYDILSNHYQIKQIAIDSGICNLSWDKSGQANFNILKPSSSKNQNSFLLLKTVQLSRLQVYYIDPIAEQDYHFHIEQATLTFKRSRSLDELSCQSHLFVHHLNSKKLHILNKRNMDADFTLKVDEEHALLSLLNCKLNLEQLKLSAAGSINYGKLTKVDLKIEAEEAAIQSILALTPITLPEAINAYQSKGQIAINATIKGILSTHQTPAISVLFSVKNGSLTEPNSKTTLSKINCQGEFTNGSSQQAKTSQLNISPFQFELEGGQLSGSLKVEDLTRPYITMIVDADLPIAPLLKFQQSKWLSEASGNIRSNLTIKGFLFELSKDMVGTISSGSIEISAHNIAFHHSPKKINQFESTISLKGNALNLSKCFIQTDQTDVNVSGSLNNIFGYLFNKESLNANIQYQSKLIDVAHMLLFSDPSSSNDTGNIELPNRINLQMGFNIDNLKYHLFEAKSISGTINWKGKKLDLQNFKCNTMGGKLLINAQVENAPNGKFLMSANSELTAINLAELFRQCADFGQQEITSQHINGLLTGKIELVSVWTGKLECETDKLFVNSDVVIKNGSLTNYKPLESLSTYAKVEDLKSLRFEELKNKIQISNRSIFIPEMEAKNNALNVTISGTHTFDNMIDYKVKVRLRELLTKKRKILENEFGEEDETGKGLYLYLTMKGPIANPKISYDKIAVKQKITQDLNQESNTIKQVLRESLGIGKDTLIKEKKNSSDELEFEKE